MSYEQITDGEIDGGSIADVTLFTKIRNDIRDHVHGDSDVAPPGKVLGSWVSRSFGTSYLAATDLLICAYVYDNGMNSTLEGLTDASNPPTTVRVSVDSLQSGSTSSITFPVRKGDYWKVNRTGGGNTAILNEIGIGT